MNPIVLIVLFLLAIAFLGGGFGLYGHQGYGPTYGYGSGGLGLILLIVVVVLFLR